MCPMDSIQMTCLSSESYIVWTLPDGSYIPFYEEDYTEVTLGVFTATLTDPPYTTRSGTKLSTLEFPALPELKGTKIHVSVSDSSFSDLEVAAMCTVTVQGTFDVMFLVLVTYVYTYPVLQNLGHLHTT